MPTTVVSLPLGGGSWVTENGFAPAVRRVEIGNNLYLNCAGQQNPTHTYYWISQMDPATRAFTNFEGFYVRNQNYPVQYMQLHKLSDSKVVAFFPQNSGTNSSGTIIVQIVSFDSAAKTVSAAPASQFATPNFSGFGFTEQFAMRGVDKNGSAQFFLANASVGLFNFTINTTTGLFTQVTSASYTATQPAVDSMLVPASNGRFIISGRYALNNSAMYYYDPAAHSTTSFELSTNTVWSSQAANFSSYRTMYGANNTLLGFTADGKRVIHGQINQTAIYALTNPQNNGTVGAFENVSSNNIVARALYAIDDNHFVQSYVEMSGVVNSDTPSGKPTTSVPVAMHFRFWERVNNDVWVVSDRSKGAGGYVVTLPTTNGVANAVTPFAGWLSSGNIGLKLESNFSWTFSFQYGNRFTTYNVG